MESKTVNKMKTEFIHVVCMFFLFFVFAFINVVIREYGGVILNKTLSAAYAATILYFMGYWIFKLMKYFDKKLT